MTQSKGREENMHLPVASFPEGNDIFSVSVLLIRLKICLRYRLNASTLTGGMVMKVDTWFEGETGAILSMVTCSSRINNPA